MNFLFFSAQFLPHMGGVENYTYNISKKLIKYGHNVTVVTSNTTDSSSIEVYEGINVFRLDCYNLLDGRFPIYKRNQNYKKIFNKLDQQAYDFCVINTRFYFHSILGAKYSYKRNIPNIVIDHGTSHLTVHSIFLDFIGAMFEHLLTRYLRKYCRDFYGVSKASSQWLQHFNIQSKGEIYNAIDLDKIENIKMNAKLNFRMKYNVPEERIIICYTGRLIKEKGILQLVQAVQKINHEGNKICCMIAGEGPLKEDLLKLNDPNVIVLGRLSFEDVIHMLSESNIFCLPSDSEGFSTSILEAAACRNYIVTTARGGAREVLLDDTYGLVIENNDLESVYSAIKVALNCDYKKEAVSKVYKRVENNFTWNITSKRILEVYKNKVETLNKNQNLKEELDLQK